ncbi:hypothetical protein [Streptomyces sp. ODS28]|uniref:hypothetical protein n=1 Tax=Streptomyces sp. ODS28 TaxID=3136688 RepID=UPI0031EB5DDC
MPPTPHRWTAAPPSDADWLADLTGDDGLTGFLAPGRPDAAWVLNAMYEHESGAGTVSHDALHRARLARGEVAPLYVGGANVEETPGMVTTGGDVGRAEHPGPGWRRLRWAELARRHGDPVVPEGRLPCLHCLPSARMADGSWPAGIAVPTEGSLDRETWNRLTALLTAFAPEGPATPCRAYYNPLARFAATGDATEYDTRCVRAGTLGGARALYDAEETAFSPSNLWPEDRTWVLCTDYDLWGTKVVGPKPLIERLLRDEDLEAVRLPWAP